MLEEEQNAFQYEYFLGKLRELVTFINNEYSDNETPLTEEIATVIISLACGELMHLETMAGLMDQIHGDDSPVQMRVVKELLLITSGLAERDVIEYLLGDTFNVATSVDDEEESIFKMINIDPLSVQFEFLIKIATGDITWMSI
jgi:hypothetical protein